MQAILDLRHRLDLVDSPEHEVIDQPPDLLLLRPTLAVAKERPLDLGLQLSKAAKPRRVSCVATSRQLLDQRGKGAILCELARVEVTFHCLRF